VLPSRFTRRAPTAIFRCHVGAPGAASRLQLWNRSTLRLSDWRILPISLDRRCFERGTSSDSFFATAAAIASPCRGTSSADALTQLRPPLSEMELTIRSTNAGQRSMRSSLSGFCSSRVRGPRRPGFRHSGSTVLTSPKTSARPQLSSTAPATLMIRWVETERLWRAARSDERLNDPERSPMAPRAPGFKTHGDLERDGGHPERIYAG